MGYRLFAFLLGFIFLLASCSQSHNNLESQAGSWQILGPVQGTQGAFPPPTSVMSLNSLGNPGIAYFNSLPYFMYFEGTGWLGTGNLQPSVGYSAVGGVDIVFDTLDRPVVAYSLWTGGAGGGFIYVKRYNATTGLWGTLASLSLGNDYVYQIELELPSSTRPIIAYQTGHGGSTVNVKGWNGSSWTDYGDPEYSAYAFSLALDKTKQPILAYEKSGNGSIQVLVKKWHTTSGWLPVGGPLNLSNSGSKPPVIDTDINGNPVVAWSEYNNLYTYESSHIYVKRWVNNNWQALGNFVTDNARVYNLDMTLDGESNPYVIWQNDVDKAIYVKHWKPTESRWRFVGPNPVSNLYGFKVGIIPSIDWRNNTLVASWSRPATTINGISYNGRILTKRYIP